MKHLKTFITVYLFLFISLFVTSVSANHSWGKYHWNKSTADSTVNPLVLADNLDSNWDGSLIGSSADWNLSVLKNQVVSKVGNTNCSPTSGQVEVCNGEYGDNGWLGIASIWVTRGRSGHITQGVVKVNDTYFNTPSYNSPAWRNFVMCQEVGHTFGLGHQDEAFGNLNLGSCMDYTSDPDGSILGQLDNQHPNQHDYDEMTDIYAHLNSTDDGGEKGNGNGKGNGGGRGKPADVGVDIDLNDPTQWGKAVKQDAQGRNSLFERILPNGQILITHVIWAD